MRSNDREYRYLDPEAIDARVAAGEVAPVYEEAGVVLYEMLLDLLQLAEREGMSVDEVDAAVRRVCDWRAKRERRRFRVHTTTKPESQEHPMDERTRAAARRAEAGGLEDLIQLALERRRANPHRRRLTEGDLVSGPALGLALKEALSASGQREIDLVRASEVPVPQHGRWVRALRDLIGGKPRSWCWAERWLPLLGIDEASFWSSLADRVPHPQQAERVPRDVAAPRSSSFFAALGRRRPATP